METDHLGKIYLTSRPIVVHKKSNSEPLNSAPHRQPASICTNISSLKLAIPIIQSNYISPAADSQQRCRPLIKLAISPRIQTDRQVQSTTNRKHETNEHKSQFYNSLSTTRHRTTNSDVTHNISRLKQTSIEYDDALPEIALQRIKDVNDPVQVNEALKKMGKLDRKLELIDRIIQRRKELNELDFQIRMDTASPLILKLRHKAELRAKNRRKFNLKFLQSLLKTDHTPVHSEQSPRVMIDTEQTPTSNAATPTTFSHFFKLAQSKSQGNFKPGALNSPRQYADTPTPGNFYRDYRELSTDHQEFLGEASNLSKESYPDSPTSKIAFNKALPVNGLGISLGMQSPMASNGESSISATERMKIFIMKTRRVTAIKLEEARMRLPIFVKAEPKEKVIQARIKKFRTQLSPQQSAEVEKSFENSLVKFAVKFRNQGEKEIVLGHQGTTKKLRLIEENAIKKFNEHEKKNVFHHSKSPLKI